MVLSLTYRGHSPSSEPQSNPCTEFVPQRPLAQPRASRSKGALGAILDVCHLKARLDSPHWA